MFLMTSSRVSPWDTQPGSAGGDDVSPVCFLLKDHRIAHRVWPLILIIPANTPRTAAVRQFLTGIVWLRGRRLQLPGDASRVKLRVGVVGWDYCGKRSANSGCLPSTIP